MKRPYGWIVICWFAAGCSLYGMTTLSTTHFGAYRVDAHVDSVSSLLPVSLGGTFEVQADGTGLVSAACSTGFSGHTLGVAVQIISEEPWVFDNRVEAQIDYVFLPDAPFLDVSFSGLSGDHAFESGSFYTLMDLNTATAVDQRSWEYEMGVGFVDDILPYAARYRVMPDRAYRLTLGAYGTLGDLRLGYAWLEVTLDSVNVVPAPGALLLAAMGTMFVVGKLRNKRPGRRS